MLSRAGDFYSSKLKAENCKDNSKSISIYNPTLYSNNMYQIFICIKNRVKARTGNVSGVLLYVKTDEEIVPDNDYPISGNRISVKTLDLNAEFADIAKQLDVLADGVFHNIVIKELDLNLLVML